MDIVVHTSSLLFTILVFVRISAFFLLIPVINFIRLPVVVRISLAVALSVFLKTFVISEGSPDLVPDYRYLMNVMIEVVNGAALAFGMFAAFATFQLAGRIIDFQMGLAVANQVDPITNAPSPLVGTVLFLLGSIVFILAGGMEVVLKVLVLSFESFPPGQSIETLSLSSVSDSFGLMFSVSVILIAPIIVTLFLIDIAMAFSARFMPQMNVFILSIPLKVAIGFSVLAMAVVWMNPVFEKVFDILFAYWYGLL